MADAVQAEGMPCFLQGILPYLITGHNGKVDARIIHVKHVLKPTWKIPSKKAEQGNVRAFRTLLNNLCTKTILETMPALQ
jgi:hypothetical protein